MSPLLVAALRRMAWYALGLAIVLVVVFKLLPAFGVLGPSAEDHVNWAGEALATARVYGAGPELPAFATATAEIEEARKLLAAGHPLQARRVALRAQERAVEAQAIALTAREEDRRRARKIVDEVDKSMNEIENLYNKVSAHADKDSLGDMLAIMKNARATGAALFLSFDQGNYKGLLADEANVKERLRQAKASLEALRPARVRKP
jgi:hypothetical protein